MCLRNVYYPLVHLKDGKNKVLFDCYIKVNNREDIENMVDIQKEAVFAKIGSSQYGYLNKLFKRNDVKELEKMVQIPCGSCRECLNDISRQWAFRIMNEAAKYDDNYFITFTINDEHLISPNLDPLFFQKFNKKLKTYLKRQGCKSDFRFYGVGEYGLKSARCHYHCIYFNLDLPDLKYHHIDSNHQLHFTSKFLEDVYSVDLNGIKSQIGFVDIGSVDIGSACYVARYCDKKRRLTTSERVELIEKGIVPEFSAMSRRPGIGADNLEEFLEDFKNGVYKHFIHGKSYSLPLYYNKKIKEILKGTEVLAQYEEQARKNSAAKMFQQLELSDYVGDIDTYNESLNIVKTKRKL